MEEKYWEQFLATGEVKDYLAYKASFEREETRESDYSDRDGDLCITDRRI